MLFKKLIKRTKNINFFRHLVGLIGYGCIRILFATYRIRVNNSIPSIKTQPCVFYFWHQHLIPGLFFFYNQGMRGHCVVSPSNDGKIIGSILQKLGFTVLYGSAHKEPIALVRKCMTVLKSRHQLCLVGDGSRGPAKQLQEGIPYLAQKANVPTIYIECSVGWPLTMKKSWDQFQIPLPFSKITVTVHEQCL